MSAVTTCGVKRLPPELLHLVFELVKSEVCAEYEAAPTDKEGARKPDWMAWRAVTQVCERWRRIALASSTLWREIKFRRVGLAWGLAMLSRSRLSPLKIELGHAPGYSGFPSEASSLQFATTLLDHAGNRARLQTFTLFGVDMDAVAAMLFVADAGAYPALEDLQVETRWDDVQVSFDALRRSMPALRELRLYGPSLTHPPAAPLPHLTHLNLQHDSPAHGSTGALLPLLLSKHVLPALLDLQLTDVFPPRALLDAMAVDLATSVATVSLTTRCFPDWAMAFGSALKHTTATRDYVLEDCEPTQLAHLLAAHAGQTAPKQPTQLGIVIGHPPNSLTLSLSYEPWPRTPPLDARVPRHAFSVTFGDQNELWDVLADSVDMRAVHDLSFEDDSGLDQDGDQREEHTRTDRWTLFLAAPIKRIRVTGLACRTLFALLTLPASCPTCDSPTSSCAHLPSLFPHLHELTILESPDRPPRPLGPAPFALGTDLLDAVRARERQFPGVLREVKVPDRFLYDAWVDDVLLEVGRVSNSRYRYF